MRIAICDDDPTDLQDILSLVEQYAPFRQSQVTTCTDAASFYLAHQSEPFDLAILDIEMPDPLAPNGYDIAKKLVEEDPSPPVILFVTNSMDYTIKGYGIAFRYIPKPLQRASFFEVLDATVKEISAERFLFSANGASHLVRLQDIYYFEVYGHITTLYTAQEKFMLRESLQSISERLPPGWFGAPHISYLVNLDHVQNFSKTEVQMDNRAKIPLARRKYECFAQQIYRFVER